MDDTLCMRRMIGICSCSKTLFPITLPGPVDDDIRFSMTDEIWFAF